MRILTGLLVLALSAAAPAQVSSDEAYQKLQEKQKQRQAERMEKVTITRGQLDDMTAEIQRLRAEVATLRGKLAERDAPPTSRPVIHDDPIAAGIKHGRLVIGMTLGQANAAMGRDGKLVHQIGGGIQEYEWRFSRIALTPHPEVVGESRVSGRFLGGKLVEFLGDTDVMAH